MIRFLSFLICFSVMILWEGGAKASGCLHAFSEKKTQSSSETSLENSRIKIAETSGIDISKSSKPPLNSKNPFVGDLFKIIKSPLKYFENLMEIKNSVVRIHGSLLLKDIVVLQDPDLVKDLFDMNKKDIDLFSGIGGAIPDKYVDKITGSTIFTTKGEEWKLFRKISSSFFTPKYIKTLESSMRDVTREFVQNAMDESFRTNTPIDIFKFTNEVNFLLFSKILFPSSQSGSFDRIFKEEQSLLNGYIQSQKKLKYLILMSTIRSADNFLPKDVRDSDKRINDILFDLIPKRRKEIQEKNITEPESLMDAFILEKKINGEKFNDLEIAQQIKIFLVAGHETTGTSLAWGVVQLFHNKSAIEKMLQEKESHSEYSSMEYTKQIVKETLRLHPPIMVLFKRISQDLMIDNYFVKKNSAILVNVYGMQRSDKFYKDSHEFKPERHDEDSSEKNCLFLAFGGGPRVCQGMALSYLQMTIIFQEMFSQYNIEITEKAKDIIPDYPVIINKPSKPVYLKVLGKK